MEQSVLDLLQATTVPDTSTIRRAEDGLTSLYPINDFPLALLNIASHNEVNVGSRKAALTTLRKYVESTWSPNFEEATYSQIHLPEEVKAQVRSRILSICTSAEVANNDGQALAASVVSKIASADFPDQWPDLFPHLVSVLNAHASDAATLGSLRVMYELVDSGLSDEQFFVVASDLVKALHQTTTTGHRGAIVQAMALKVLSSCLDNLEQVLETEHAPAVKVFLNESVRSWMPYFTSVLRQPLPDLSQDGSSQGTVGIQRAWKGVVAVKIQVVQTLAKIKRVHIHSITPHVFDLFQILWDDLSRLESAYAQLFVNSDGEGKLVDSDGLPYTLDALIIESIDFLSTLLKAKAVRGELLKQSPKATTQVTAAWLQQLIRVVVQYARIPMEEQSMWQIDANIYLSETTSTTANYTPRTACAELVARTLMEWLGKVVIEALVHYSSQVRSNSPISWREQEALAYLLTQAMKDVQEVSGTIEPETTNKIMELLETNTRAENEFLRGAAHLALATLFAVSKEESHHTATASLTSTLDSFTSDDSTIVAICCLISVPQYIETLPRAAVAGFQTPILQAVQSYLSQHDLQDELDDSDDIKAALITLVRDAILLDPAAAVDSDSSALDIFFNLCSACSSNFMLTEQLNEAFELLVEAVAEAGPETYTALSSRAIPSLTAAFHLAEMHSDPSLTTLAAELVSRLSEHGTTPLPSNFIPAFMPGLHRILMNATEASVIRPATSAVTFMLEKGTAQYLSWTLNNKSSVELTLVIINRLLNSPEIEESASENVGALASALVTHAGATALGSYLSDLLRAIAIRLATATRIQFIQSLLMVFANLATQVPADVLAFLSEIQITINQTSSSALTLTVQKWLENSVHFAGFDEIRQNVIALSKIYSLHDPRLHNITVKGDLIVQPPTNSSSARIKTRSQARLNPDTYTSIPADLKILKLLVDELKNAAISGSGFETAGAAGIVRRTLEDDAESLQSDDNDDDDEDGAWEDEDLAPGTDGSLDLSSPEVRRQLMGFAGENVDSEIESGGGNANGDGAGNRYRPRDDEAADYLVNWFRTESSQPGFEGMFQLLSHEEKEILRELVR